MPRVTPCLEELRQLYAIYPLSQLAAQYGVGYATARAWLVGAGIPVRATGRQPRPCVAA